MGIKMALPYANRFMSKEELTIILAFFYLIYFWKRFIDEIYLTFLGSHRQLESLMEFMNTINNTIKYTFTYSKQTVSSLNVQVYLSEFIKLKTNFNRKSTECMTLLHFHSHHPLNCEEGIIYSQALRYNMIISENYILQEELNNLTRILLARAYPLHLIITNIKKLSSTPAATSCLNGHHIQKQSFFPSSFPSQTLIFSIPSIPSPFTLIATTLKNWHIIADDATLSAIWPSKPLPVYSKSSIILTAILSTLHKHMAYHNTIPSTVTHIHLHTPKHTCKHTHSNYTILFSPISNSTQLIVVMLTT